MYLCTSEYPTLLSWPMSTANTVLDELLEPVGACFTPEVAQRLINLRASSSVQKRIEELAHKSEQGQLSRLSKRSTTHWYPQAISSRSFNQKLVDS